MRYVKGAQPALHGEEEPYIDRAPVCIGKVALELSFGKCISLGIAVHSGWGTVAGRPQTYYCKHTASYACNVPHYVNMNCVL